MSEMTLDWELITEAALALGVRESNLEKWRQRKSVPHKWRLPIIRYCDGRISLDAFETSGNSQSESVQA